VPVRCEFLENIIRNSTVLPHVVAIDDVHLFVFSGHDRQMTRRAAAVHQIRQQHRRRRTQIFVEIVVADGDGRSKVVRHRQRHARPKFHERVAVIVADSRGVPANGVAGREVHVSRSIRRWSATAQPDTRFAAVRHQVNGTHLR